MKKFLVAAIAASFLAVFASCGSSEQVEKITKPSDIKDMTDEKAKGFYTLTDAQVGEITEEDYEINTIELKADGSFILTVMTKDGSEFKGENDKYTVNSDGTVVLTHNTTVCCKDETILCDGDKIQVSGSLGTMVYTKDVEPEEDTPAAEEKEDTAEEKNAE